MVVGVAGCTSKVERPAPQERLAAGVLRSDGRWEVPGLKHGPTYYIWSPDRKWIGFHLSSGVWAVSADGRTEHLLAGGEYWRELVGWWQGGLVYLEHRDGDVVVGLGRPGQEARKIATLPLKRAANDLFISRYAIYGDELALFPGDWAPLRVNLGTGAVQDLGGASMPGRCAPPGPSPDQRYLLFINGCEYDAVRVVDLQTWTVRKVSGEGYPFGAVWSPVENRWAALAGAPGTGDTTQETFADHLDIGDEQGQVVRHLKPPEPLKLKGAPYWSADGRSLAVVAEAVPASDGRGRDAITEVWAVTPATGVWRKVATLQFVHLQGWHPSGKYLVVWKIMGSAAPPTIGTMDAETGSVTWVPMPTMELRDATRLDERLLVVAGSRRDAAVYQERPGLPPLALAPGQVPFMDAIQVRPPYVSWIAFGKDGPEPSLVVDYRP